MKIEAWLVVSEPHHREALIDHAAAVDHAVRRHGIIRGLVLAEEVDAMCRAAYERGLNARTTATPQGTTT